MNTIKGSQDLTCCKSTPTTWTNGLKKKIPSNKSLTGNNTQVQAKDKIIAEPIPSPPTTRSSVPLGGKFNDALIRSDNKSSIK